MYSPQLLNAVTLAVKRLIGSHGVVQFWRGPMPASCDDPATGERVGAMDMPDDFIGSARDEIEPALPPGANYWRLLDANGTVMMQGNGDVAQRSGVTSS